MKKNHKPSHSKLDLHADDLSKRLQQEEKIKDEHELTNEGTTLWYSLKLKYKLNWDGNQSKWSLEANDRTPEDAAFIQVGKRLVSLIKAVAAGHQFIQGEFGFFSEAQVHGEVLVRYG